MQNCPRKYYMFTFFLYPLSHCVQTSLGKAMGYIRYHSLFSIFMPYLKSFPLRCCCLSALSSFSLRFTPVLWNQRRLCHWKGELGPQGVAWSKQWCELNTLIPICPTVGDISTLWSVLSNGGGKLPFKTISLFIYLKSFYAHWKESPGLKL